MKGVLGGLAAVLIGAALGLFVWRTFAGQVQVPLDEVPPEPLTAASAPRRVAVGPNARATESNAEISRANNEAVEALEAGDVERAIALLETCVAKAPAERVFAANLAEALARRAVRDHASAGEERKSALLDLERAVELDGERADLVSLLERWRAAAEVEANFAAYGSTHFELAFDGERGEILRGAQGAIDVLERAYGEFVTLFQRDPLLGTGRRIRVVLTTRAEFERSTGLGHWAGGAFDGTLRLPIEDFEGGRDGWSQVLRHELAHLFVHELGGPKVPGWLNEGLAQWVEETRPAELQRARRALAGRELLSLADLAAPLARLSEPERIQLAYQQSLLFVAHLMEHHGEWLVLKLLERSGRGESVESSFRELSGIALDDAHEQFRGGF